MFTIREAAVKVGLTRQALYARIKRGTVSTVKDEQGRTCIDAAEMLRAFGYVENSDGLTEEMGQGVNVKVQSVSDMVNVSQESLQGLKYVVQRQSQRIDELEALVRSKEDERLVLLQTLKDYQAGRLLPPSRKRMGFLARWFGVDKM